MLKIKLLVFGSLSLLIIFLGLWLNKVYFDERRALKREIDLMFMRSLRDSEKGLFNLNRQNKGGNIETITIKSDSVSAPNNGKIKMIVVNSKDIRRSGNNIDTTENRESSIHISWEGKKDKSSDSCTDINIDDVFMKNFDTLFQNSKLPFNYELVPLNPEDSNKKSIFFFNLDRNFNRSLALQSTDYQFYIAKKMIPHICFALLLFGAVSFSFLMMYRNWREQQRMLALKNNFISNITHEFNSPITSIGLAIEAMLNNNFNADADKSKKYLNIAQTELKRLSGMVEKILKISVLEESKMAFDFKKLDFKALLENQLHSFDLQINHLGGNLQLETIGTNFILNGDETHLINVIHNLLENATKYCKQQPQIKVKLIEDTHHIRLKISDNGIGMAAEHLKHIFDKFYRIPTGNVHNVKGYGLGLSHVKEILDAHQATILVRSELGKGSDFEIVFKKCNSLGS